MTWLKTLSLSLIFLSLSGFKHAVDLVCNCVCGGSSVIYEDGYGFAFTENFGSDFDVEGHFVTVY